MATKTKIDRDTPIKDFVMGSGKVKRPRPEAETQARIDRDGNAVEVSTDVPDTLALVGDVDGQTMRNIIGVPIETDEESVLTSHNTPDPGGEAPTHATTSNIEDGVAEPGTPIPAERSDKTDAHPSVDLSGKMDVGTVDTVPSAHATHSEDSEPRVRTTHITSTERREAIAPTPQTAPAEPSIDSGDTAPAAPSLDTDPIRRSVKRVIWMSTGGGI